MKYILITEFTEVTFMEGLVCRNDYLTFYSNVEHKENLDDI